MGDYKVFDGQNWLDPCFHDIYFLDRQLGWQLLDPKVRDINYHDGTYTAGFPTWKPMTCICTCPEFSIPNPITGACQALQSPVFPGIPQLLDAGDTVTSYNKFGIRLYKELGLLASPSSGVITSPNFSLPLLYPTGTTTVKDTAGITVPILSQKQSQLWGIDDLSTYGRMNLAGVWAGNLLETSFSSCINITAQKEYILAIAADNYVKLEIDLGATGSFAVLFNGYAAGSDTVCFNSLHAFPITLPVGNHIIKLTGKNIANSNASVVAEIYEIPLATFQSTLLTSTNVAADIEPYIYFTSKTLIGVSIAPPGTLPSEYTCLTGTLDLCAGVPVCRIDVDCVENGGVPVIPPEPPVPQIDATTEINIWFDDSGSMGSTLSPLEVMKDTILQACLIQLYNNDQALYDEKVKVLRMQAGVVSGINTGEAFMICIGAGRNISRTVDTSTNLVINLCFTDENDPYYYGTWNPTWDNTVRKPHYQQPTNFRYDTDLAQVKANIVNSTTENYSIRGCVFRVDSGGYSSFRSLVQATFIDEGAYSSPNNLSVELAANIFKYRLDTTAGSTPVYYKDQIVQALNDLGISLLCP
jgi:hypothetical protein